MYRTYGDEKTKILLYNKMSSIFILHTNGILSLSNAKIVQIEYRILLSKYSMSVATCCYKNAHIPKRASRIHIHMPPTIHHLFFDINDEMLYKSHYFIDCVYCIWSGTDGFHDTLWEASHHTSHKHNTSMIAYINNRIIEEKKNTGKQQHNIENMR